MGVDIGLLHIRLRRMQNAADVGALVGFHALGDHQDARAAVAWTAELNGYKNLASQQVPCTGTACLIHRWSLIETYRLFVHWLERSTVQRVQQKHSSQHH